MGPALRTPTANGTPHPALFRKGRGKKGRAATWGRPYAHPRPTAPLTLPSPSRGEGKKAGRPHGAAPTHAHGQRHPSPYPLPQGAREKRPGEMYLAPTHTHEQRHPSPCPLPQGAREKRPGEMYLAPTHTHEQRHPSPCPLMQGQEKNGRAATRRSAPLQSPTAAGPAFGLAWSNGQNGTAGPNILWPRDGTTPSTGGGRPCADPTDGGLLPMGHRSVQTACQSWPRHYSIYSRERKREIRG